MLGQLQLVRNQRPEFLEPFYSVQPWMKVEKMKVFLFFLFDLSYVLAITLPCFLAVLCVYMVGEFYECVQNVFVCGGIARC